MCTRLAYVWYIVRQNKNLLPNSFNVDNYKLAKKKCPLNYSPLCLRTMSWLRFRRSNSPEVCKHWRSPEMPGTRPSSCAVSKTVVGHRCRKHKMQPNIYYIYGFQTTFKHYINISMYFNFFRVVFAPSDDERWPRNV